MGLFGSINNATNEPHWALSSVLWTAEEWPDNVVANALFIAEIP